METGSSARSRGEKASDRGIKRASAMSHPVRAQALRLLVERGEMSPKEIADEIGEDVQKVSYHVRRLCKLDCAELVREVPVASKGAVQHFYVATERHLLETNDWESMDEIVGGGILDEIMQKVIDDFAESRRAEVIGSDSHFHLTRTPLVLDEEGLQEALENSERWRIEQSEIERRSAERLSERNAVGIPVASSLGVFKMAPKK